MIPPVNNTSPSLCVRQVATILGLLIFLYSICLGITESVILSKNERNDIWDAILICCLHHYLTAIFVVWVSVVHLHEDHDSGEPSCSFVSKFSVYGVLTVVAYTTVFAINHYSSSSSPPDLKMMILIESVSGLSVLCAFGLMCLVFGCAICYNCATTNYQPIE